MKLSNNLGNWKGIGFPLHDKYCTQKAGYFIFVISKSCQNENHWPTIVFKNKISEPHCSLTNASWLMAKSTEILRVF